MKKDSQDGRMAQRVGHFWMHVCVSCLVLDGLISECYDNVRCIYNLWLPWRDTGCHLARQFLDYEPGIHWSQVGMQSGTTGINTIRAYSMTKQGRDQDPDGDYIRKWCLNYQWFLQNIFTSHGVCQLNCKRVFLALDNTILSQYWTS